MITDSIANASIPMPPPPLKDLSKKKRGNRTAKLKQCKLDARREQWLSQVKNGCKEEKVLSLHVGNEGKTRFIKKLEIEPREGKIIDPVYSDSDSPSHSPSSHVSSILGSNMSGTNFTASCSGSSSSSESCSGSVFGEEEYADEDGCIDNWETIADALAASDDKPKLDLPVINQAHELVNRSVELTKPKQEQKRAVTSSMAWKPDDAFRPQSLPNLAKQNSFPLRKHYRCGGGSVWARKSVVSAPTACPICCEDLDLTDSSFHPCSCGFRLCLFCHKRILEEDGRCPGCRKPYESAALHLARSCSMITRF